MMTDGSLQARIDELKRALAHLEQHPERHLPGEDALKEFQSIVDTTRQEVWTALTEQHVENHDEFVTAFRLRRASAMLERVYRDLGACRMPATPEALDGLRTAIDELVNATPDSLV